MCLMQVRRRSRAGCSGSLSSGSSRGVSTTMVPEREVQTGSGRLRCAGCGCATVPRRSGLLYIFDPAAIWQTFAPPLTPPILSRSFRISRSFEIAGIDAGIPRTRVGTIGSDESCRRTRIHGLFGKPHGAVQQKTSRAKVRLASSRSAWRRPDRVGSRSLPAYG